MGTKQSRQPLLHLLADAECFEFARHILSLALFQLQPLQGGDHMRFVRQRSAGVISPVLPPPREPEYDCAGQKTQYQLRYDGYHEIANAIALIFLDSKK